MKAPRHKDASAATVAAVARLHGEGVRPPKIAERIGRCPSTVYRALKMAGITIDPTPDRVEVDGSAVAQLYAGGASMNATSKAFGVSRKVAARRVERAGIPIRPYGPRLRIAELLRRYRAGQSQRALARDYEVSEGVIGLRLDKAGVRRRTGSEAKAATRQLRRESESGNPRARTGSKRPARPPARRRATTEGNNAKEGTPRAVDKIDDNAWHGAAFDSLEFATLAPNAMARRIVILQERIIAGRGGMRPPGGMEALNGEPPSREEGGKWGEGALAAVELAVRAPLPLAERTARLGRVIVDGRQHLTAVPGNEPASRPDDQRTEPGTSTRRQPLTGKPGNGATPDAGVSPLTGAAAPSVSARGRRRRARHEPSA